MPEQIIEPPFPLSGVVRSTRNWGDMALGEKAFAPWAVNVFPEGPYASRLRGGSRPGLTDTTDGRPTQTDRLVDESGNYIVTEAGDYITVQSSGAVPTSDGRAYVETGGDYPSGYSEACLYRDRVCMTKSDSLAVHMSRQGVHHDWDIAKDVEDEQRAFLLQLVDAGEWYSSEAGVTALIPYKDQALIAGTANTLWALVGDPTADGTFRNVSRDVGIVSAKAWCKAEEDVFFLSSRGLYVVGGNGESLTPVSESLVPEELAGVSSAVMGYRAEDGGVYIFTGGSYHWFYHLATKSFWPFTLSSSHVPTEAYKDGRDLVLLCTDASYRKIGGDDDDGTAIESHILLGPYRSAAGDMSGIVTSIEGALAEDSGDVSWAIITGSSAEKVAQDGKTAIGLYLSGNQSGAEAYTVASGQYSGGRSLRDHPRARGQWLAVWLYSTNKWAYEWLSCRVAGSGRYR